MVSFLETNNSETNQEESSFSDQDGAKEKNIPESFFNVFLPYFDKIEVLIFIFNFF